MKKVKVWIDKKAFSDVVFKGEELKQVVSDEANAIQGRAGEGYEAETKIGANRVYAVVRAATPKAYYSNLKHNTLLKSIGGS